MRVFTYLREADNLILDATVTATTEATNFGVGNLKELPVSKTWKSTAGSLSDQKLTVDLGSSKVVSVIALINHNLRPTATVSVRASNMSDFSGTLTTFNVPPAVRRNAWRLLDVAVSRRYWEIKITDTGHPNDHLQVGYLMLGEATVLPEQFQPGWGRSPRKIIRKTDSEIGTPLVGRTISKGYVLNFTFLLDHEETETLETLLDSLEGSPMFVVPKPDLPHAFLRAVGRPGKALGDNRVLR